MKTLVTAAATLILTASFASAQAIEFNEQSALDVWMEPALEAGDDKDDANLWAAMETRFVDLGDTWAFYQSDEAEHLTNNQKYIYYLNYARNMQHWDHFGEAYGDNLAAIVDNLDDGFTGQNTSIALHCAGGNSVGSTSDVVNAIAPNAEYQCSSNYSQGNGTVGKNGYVVKFANTAEGLTADEGHTGFKLSEETTSWGTTGDTGYAAAAVATTWNRFGNLSGSQMTSLLEDNIGSDGLLDVAAMNSPLSNNY